ncbi:putative phage tail protein [Paenibacillus senegalensis]|uniref:putative phage tail protein n=1 Tax=Paenibacillus senegalensis TaxID=1465766 RepID=UPI000288D672|nr:putative phage tail protein [Paenibacillus senegalensis]
MSDPILSYLPEWYSQIREMKQLAEVEDRETAELERALQRLLDDQFVETASERAIRRRELQLGIRADPVNEDLQLRRLRLINRYSTRPPFTLRYLQDRLDFLLEPGRASVRVDVENFILTLTTSVEDANLFREVEYTVKTVVPANIVYQQETAIKDQIGLQEKISYLPLTRETRLSTGWRLGVVPFASEGSEVIVK